MVNPYSLLNKQILVTGASSGIGRAIAIACANMGAVVTVTGRNKQKLEETISLMSGNGHQLLKADLTNNEERSLLVENLPKLDGIVHNAGVGSRVLCKNMIEDDISKVLNPNFIAPVLLQSEILRAKKVNKEASIILIASMAAKMPSVGNAIYSASKGAIISYAKCLGLELAPRKIRVNCICPAMVWTDLIIQEGFTKKEMEEAQNKYPLKRYGQPEDIANMVVYLFSDASSWITGSCMEISGGAKGL